MKTTFHPEEQQKSIKMFYGKSVICKLDENRPQQPHLDKQHAKAEFYNSKAAKKCSH